MRHSEAVAAVILAAGTSTRMGTPNKLLLPLGSESVVQRAVRTARAAHLDPVIVVLGHDAARVQEELGGLECQPVVNPNYALGIKTSLRYGMQQVPDRCEAAVVLLADMPFVTAAMLGAVLASYGSTRAPLVASRFGAVHAPPTLYGRALFNQFTADSPERCGKALLAAYLDQAAFVEQPEHALTDLDDPDDYQRVCAQFTPDSPANAVG